MRQASGWAVREFSRSFLSDPLSNLYTVEKSSSVTKLFCDLLRVPLNELLNDTVSFLTFFNISYDFLLLLPSFSMYFLKTGSVT